MAVGHLGDQAGGRRRPDEDARCDGEQHWHGGYRIHLIAAEIRLEQNQPRRLSAWPGQACQSALELGLARNVPDCPGSLVEGGHDDSFQFPGDSRRAARCCYGVGFAARRSPWFYCLPFLICRDCYSIIVWADPSRIYHIILWTIREV